MTDYIELLLAEQEDEETRREREALSLQADAQEGFAEGAERREPALDRAERDSSPGRGEPMDGAPPLSRLRRQLSRQGGAGAGREMRRPPSVGFADSSPRGGAKDGAGNEMHPFRQPAADSALPAGEFMREVFSAAWADRALRESLAALPVSRGETRVVTVRTPERGGDGWSPEGLDRAFRRDARRFDGGFSLL